MKAIEDKQEALAAEEGEKAEGEQEAAAGEDELAREEEKDEVKSL